MGLLFILHGTQWFCCRQYLLRGSLEGIGSEIKTFWALKWQRAKRVPFGPLFLLVAPDLVENGGTCLYWLRQTQQKPFSNLLNSYRAGAHCYLVTLEWATHCQCKSRNRLGFDAQRGAADKAVFNKVFKSSPKQIPLYQICGDHFLNISSISTLSRW